VIPKGKSPAPAGLFEGGAPATFVPIRRKVAGGSQVAVTVEPAGGSLQPTSKPFAVSDPV